MMLLPRRNEFSLLDQMFRDPFFTSEQNNIMKTDIKEKDDKYFIYIDLPGYKKENIKVKVENGYLSIFATTDSQNEEKENEEFVRKERYCGECSRSFYVGESVKDQDIKASFRNGTLELEIAKIQPEKKLSEETYIQISD